MLVKNEINGSVKVRWYVMEFFFVVALKICALVQQLTGHTRTDMLNRLNLSSDGTFERTLYGLVFRRRGAATCSTPLRGVRSTRYRTFALSVLFPKDRNAIRALGLEFWPETCVLYCSVCNSVSLRVNMALTKPAVRQIIEIATTTIGRGGGGFVAMGKAENIHPYRELNSEIFVDFVA
jgi:hypothetical protein